MKRGDISINMVVMAALAIIVLIVMIFVFKGQIGNVAGGFFTVGNDAKGGATGIKCDTLLSNRICGDTAPQGYEPGDIVPKPSCSPEDVKKDAELKSKGKPRKYCAWIDCKENQNCREIVKKI